MGVFKMWWNRNYVNRRDWMLENLASLDVNPSEFILLQMIDYYNSHQMELSMERLVDQTGLNVSDVNLSIASLNQKGYLTIKAVGHHIAFNIDGVFQNHQQEEYVNKDLFEIFESEFGRLLSQQDLMTLSQWSQMYEEEMILDALREAIIAQKVAMQYINGILVNKARELR